ncbi:hypothetical protein CspHIS471_0501280 [Cutaneotrichosporon sp. HIS471]|nr:hypothetical protein CspHIS471_0501280 [Cutaneotrichosporon sp. HIS471]
MALFVADEMAKQPRRGWGSALISSAVSATVFGAAVGLTAYRVWTGGWGSIVQKDALPQEPPPFDESEHSEPLPPLPFPTSPRSHSVTPRRKYATSTGSSTSPRRRYHSSPTTRRQRAKRPTIAELLAVTAPMTPVSDQDHEQLSPGSDTSEQTGVTGMADGRSPTSHTLDPIFGSDASDTDDETNTRLTAMAHRLQGLIAEGQAALSSPVSTPRRGTPRIADFPQPPPREKLPVLPLDIPRPQRGAERVSGWDTDTTEEPTRSSRSIGYGAPPRPASRPVSVASMGSVSGSFPRSASVSSNSSRYQPAVPPLPWRRESFGATSRWVQKQHSPNNSISLKNEAPLVLSRASPSTSTHPRLSQSPRVPQSPRPDSASRIPQSPRPDSSSRMPQSPRPDRPDSASRIPRPGAHSRASSIASRVDSPTPVPRRDREADTPSRRSLDRGGWNSPVPHQGLVAARTSLFASVAEINTNRSKIPIRRSMGSISSITAVHPSPKA